MSGSSAAHILPCQFLYFKTRQNKDTRRQDTRRQGTRRQDTRRQDLRRQDTRREDTRREERKTVADAEEYREKNNPENKDKLEIATEAEGHVKEHLETEAKEDITEEKVKKSNNG